MSACLGAQTGLFQQAMTVNSWSILESIFVSAQITEHSSGQTVLFSTKTKQVVMIELTVPWEDRMEEANERKK